MNHIILRNTGGDGLEPPTYRLTFCCTSNCANPPRGELSTLSVGLFWANQTHQLHEKGGLKAGPHKAGPSDLVGTASLVPRLHYIKNL